MNNTKLHKRSPTFLKSWHLTSARTRTGPPTESRASRCFQSYITLSTRSAPPRQYQFLTRGSDRLRTEWLKLASTSSQQPTVERRSRRMPHFVQRNTQEWAKRFVGLS